MGLWSRGGFDGRMESAQAAQRAQEVSRLPFCTDCPEVELKEQVEEALANPKSPEYDAANVVANMMRLAGCEGPNDITTKPSSGEFGDYESVTITVCQNPYMSGAKDIMTQTNIALTSKASAT